jgi:hypothetical protein
MVVYYRIAASPRGKGNYCRLGWEDAGSMSDEENGDGLWDEPKDEASRRWDKNSNSHGCEEETWTGIKDTISL